MSAAAPSKDRSLGDHGRGIIRGMHRYDTAGFKR
jgi:hypothetical protein